MDNRVALPVAGMWNSMMASVRPEPISPPVPNRATSSSDRPCRESDPTISQFVPAVLPIRASGNASTRASRASATNVTTTAPTRTIERIHPSRFNGLRRRRGRCGGLFAGRPTGLGPGRPPGRPTGRCVGRCVGRPPRRCTGRAGLAGCAACRGGSGVRRGWYPPSPGMCWRGCSGLSGRSADTLCAERRRMGRPYLSRIGAPSLPSRNSPGLSRGSLECGLDMGHILNGPIHKSLVRYSRSHDRSSMRYPT